MIDLTELAKSKIIQISEDEGIGHMNIRVKIIGSGCSGMTHDLFFETQIGELDEIISFDSINLIIDQVSFNYLENATIDYLDTPFSGGFKVSSPDITGSCGCGNSYKF